MSIDESPETTSPAQDPRIADLRAAAMLRDAGFMSFDATTESALATISAEMNLGRLDLIRIALTEWLEMRDKCAIPDSPGSLP
ncbi:hypothetical protein FJ970_12635 [Mesorhizobium sp. B2-1-8]|uniref:hypothetical protein n=1 Tax=unclassified Mesorhizobium TaxID=325217 RepID=UPI001127B708|nr:MULTISPECIES: hypothetical protein [unclassified Mesorhizobium]MBZ9672834.1 hypothetical protein [Mesorhizobium sp. ES1-3]TPI29860.1 hypothetical protein FJW08_16440 [Mesorhizobium sp. B3-2-1]UCI21742.1 hypothetical protein FJ970_12635 [Mesorhizobium sp. B2-1-8]